MRATVCLSLSSKFQFLWINAGSGCAGWHGHQWVGSATSWQPARLSGRSPPLRSQLTQPYFAVSYINYALVKISIVSVFFSSSQLLFGIIIFTKMRYRQQFLKIIVFLILTVSIWKIKYVKFLWKNNCEATKIMHKWSFILKIMKICII